MRWKARAEFRVVDTYAEIDHAEIRKAKLQNAKFLAHESIEIFFQAMHEAVQAIWGHPEVETESEHKSIKAA